MYQFSWPIWLRYFLKISLYPFMLLDVYSVILVDKIFQRKSIQGSCLRCGKCCRNILIFKPNNWWGRAYLKWNMEINGFYPRKYPEIEVDGQKMIIMSCRYFKKDNSCSNYFWRPVMCRRWPLIDNSMSGLRSLPGCGYKLNDDI